MKIKEYVKKRLENSIAKAARKSASIEANTACAFLSYQPREPRQIKTLRKF